MNKTFVLLAALVLSATSLSAQTSRRITVSGLITDAETGETIIGAGAMSGKSGAVTNDFGFYTLTLPSNADSVRFVSMGYQTLAVKLTAKDTVLNVKLIPGVALKEAVVTARKETGAKATKMSALEMPVTVIKSAPAIFGEPDVMKALQLLPGVQGGVDGFAGLYVRGGGPDENLLLLDGIPVYNADHMLGIFSIFQTEAVKNVTLHKGAFPARFGGRISSIIDVRTKDGNMYETHGSVGISMLCDKIHLEGPIVKGKTSYSISARGLHSILVEPILKLAKAQDINYYFYDVDAKLTHRFSDRDRLYFNVYSGADDMHFNYKENYSFEGMSGTETVNLGIKWGNLVSALRWNHVISGNLFSNVTVAYTRYNMGMGTSFKSDEVGEDGLPLNAKYGFDYLSGIRDLAAKVDFDYTPVYTHRIKFGAEYSFHTFTPETMTAMTQEMEGGVVQVDTLYNLHSSSRQYGHEVGLYVEDEMDLGETVVLDPGLRLSVFNTQGRTYFSAEPRLNAKWMPTPDFSVKAAYSRMSQYIHLLSSSMISLPIDLWVPITKEIRPETSDQVSLGFYYTGLPGWEFSVEGYYKAMQNVVEYKEGISFMFDSSGWENKVETGKGRTMGLEFFIEKTSGKTTGWLAYTLAKSDRLFPTINHGERFPYKYDRRHNVNLVVNHKFSDKFDLSATWTFASGGTTTLTERRAVMTTPNGFPYQYVDYVSGRNNYRLPPSHTLNLGFNLHRKHKHGEGIWNLSIYNVYNYMNPTLVIKTNEWETEESVDKDGVMHVNSYSKPVLKKVTILPIFPSFGYTRTF